MSEEKKSSNGAMISIITLVLSGLVYLVLKSLLAHARAGSF